MFVDGIRTGERQARLPATPVFTNVRCPTASRFVVVEDRSVPVVQTAVWYGFDQLQETPGKTGLAHALEHMLFRGTPEISAGGLDDIVARLGAQMNGQTDYDYTQFYFVTPSDKVDVTLYTEADRMQHAALRAADWAVERNAVLNELDGDASSPFFNLLSKVRAAAFPGQPSGRTPIGKRQDVANATVADLRKYYNEWYAPNNATLVIAGDISHDAAFAKARKYFGERSLQASARAQRPQPGAVSRPSGRSRVSVPVRSRRDPARVFDTGR